MKNPWTVLVQVVEPGNMQTSKVGSNFRRLLLTDSQKTPYDLCPTDTEGQILEKLIDPPTTIFGLRLKIGGRITAQPQDRSYTQTGCADCLKPLEADLTWIVQCPASKKECEVQLIKVVAIIEKEVGDN
ncbi:hypothetical protein L6452_06378 [Arctium lappa]|uniref:Uncharacterized protein n=1 Tax=Arctium lappa TaxID=4217 RepID=A0ACB9EJD2_ARCLA|nr:hypothetical protein L6452_06378 [Arctium lappa]